MEMMAAAMTAVVEMLVETAEVIMVAENCFEM